MTKTIVESKKVLRWGVQQEPSSGGSRKILWFGANRIALDEIQSIDAEEICERPMPGLLLAAYVFLIAAFFFAFLVFELGWRERFLLGTGLLVFLGLAGLHESAKIGPQRFFEIKFATRTHGIVTFSSADPHEVDALLGTLAGAGVTA